MKIYLGDLSHDTVGLATEVFPLNIGYIAAYAKKKFGNNIQIKLFKYISDLEDAIEKEPPDIMGLSNYPWCENIDYALIKQLSNRKPDALRIMGGPNFPHSSEEQALFLSKRPLLDAYTYIEGELAFSNIIELVLSQANLKEARAILQVTPIEGCVQMGEEKLLAKSAASTIDNLDDIPSPYLEGLLDPFFDGRLTPLMQTNRGCPFACTFCADGTSLVNKVKRFTRERVKNEFLYIAERVPASINILHLADLNFGMYKGDTEISDDLKEIMQRYNYPSYILANTGKNSRKRIVDAFEKLDGAMDLRMSVQSMTPDVLKNINRDNMKLDGFLGLKNTIKANNLPTSSEIILGLPGETKSSHIDSINQLMLAEIDVIVPFQLMMLNGSEMATLADRAKWGFKTKFRVLPRNFTKLKDGHNVVEYEEIVVSTKTLPFEDYVFCRKLALFCAIYNNPGFAPIFKLFMECNISPVSLLVSIIEYLDELAKSGSLRKEVHLLNRFEEQTRDENMDSIEDLNEFFGHDENFEGLITETYGRNLIQAFTGEVFSNHLDLFAELIGERAQDLLKKHHSGEDKFVQLKQVIRYCKGISSNLLGDNRLERVFYSKFIFDIKSWIADYEGRGLTSFTFQDKEGVFKFELSKDRYETIENALNQFGRSSMGVGKVLNRVRPDALWRTALLLPQNAADSYKRVLQINRMESAPDHLLLQD
jgi:radical SAM superfamily enzyme YgiQ (UPF0313 family)